MSARSATALVTASAAAFGLLGRCSRSISTIVHRSTSVMSALKAGSWHQQSTLTKRSTLLSFMRPLLHDQRRFAGHNKWSKIRHQKGSNDLARAQVYSRILRQVTSGVRAMKGETDPSHNHYLAAALQIAKANHVPKSKVEEAIKRGVAAVSGGSSGGEDVKRVVYEGLSPVKSIAVMIEALTHNVNKTANEIRHIFNAAPGAAMTSVSYLFSERRGRIVFANGNSGHELAEMADAAIEAGAEDIGKDTIEEQDGQKQQLLEVFVAFDQLVATQRALEGRGYDVHVLESGHFALEHVDLSEQEEIAAVEAFIDALEAQEEVVRVSHNANL